ncbi:hypothetical protein BDR03DRAFT_828797, partial [Suillus americanus]
AKGGDGMNFDKTFWFATAAELASKSTRVGPAKSSEACLQKWKRLHKMFKVVNKVVNTSGITYTRKNGANITAESETIWSDLLKVDPQVKSVKTTGWTHYEALLDIL